MKKVYANLLGEWIDITDTGTIDDNQDPKIFIRESGLETLSKYDYINVQYDGKNYRIHPSLIQIVTE